MSNNAILISALMVTGCSTGYAGYGSRRVQFDLPNQNASVVLVPRAQIAKHCGSTTNGANLACIKWDEEGRGVIYVPYSCDSEVVVHEFWHLLSKENIRQDHLDLKRLEKACK